MAGFKVTTRVAEFHEFEAVMQGRNNRNMLYDRRGAHLLDIDDMHVAIARLTITPPGTSLLCVRWDPVKGKYHINNLEKL
ncbi:hypothetical protein [Bradyrhizobium sp. SZCCHNS3053]|uniref:hypothetical protein n=1 Tax=Bradyrhizobium sp. SZCCHNS3053 TaxID=3057322 RepID=UPI0029168497|nr:hypothetical protein [Bradyrhizobium sp. SZCCHNS3053]